MTPDSNHGNIEIENIKASLKEVLSGKIFKNLGFKRDPFIISPRNSLDYFVNRQQEMRQLFLSLKNLSELYIPHIAILGWHGIGKTHFLKVARELINEFSKQLGYKKVYFIQGIEEFRKEFVEPLQPANLREGSEIIKEAKKGDKILVLFDDLDIIFDRFPTNCTQLFSLLEGGIIGTWDARAWDVAKKSKNAKVPKTESVLLKSLSNEHCEEIIIQRIISAGGKNAQTKLFPIYVIKRLATISDGNPYRLIIYCKRYMSFLINKNHKEINEKRFSEFCKELNIAFVDDLKNKILELTPRQRSILSLIVDKIEISTEELSSFLGIGRVGALKYLHLFKNKDILEAKQKNRTLYYYIPTEWVEEISNYLEKLEQENNEEINKNEDM